MEAFWKPRLLSLLLSARPCTPRRDRRRCRPGPTKAGVARLIAAYGEWWDRHAVEWGWPFPGNKSKLLGVEKGKPIGQRRNRHARVRPHPRDGAVAQQRRGVPGAKVLVQVAPPARDMRAQLGDIERELQTICAVVEQSNSS